MEFDDRYNVPISKKDLKFCKVDGEFVFDMAMEIDRLQEDKKELQTKLQQIREYCEKELNKPFTSICDYEQGAKEQVCNDILSILNSGGAEC